MIIKIAKNSENVETCTHIAAREASPFGLICSEEHSCLTCLLAFQVARIPLVQHYNFIFSSTPCFYNQCTVIVRTIGLVANKITDSRFLSVDTSEDFSDSWGQIRRLSLVLLPWTPSIKCHQYPNCICHQPSGELDSWDSKGEKLTGPDVLFPHFFSPQDLLQWNNFPFTKSLHSTHQSSLGDHGILNSFIVKAALSIDCAPWEKGSKERGSQFSSSILLFLRVSCLIPNDSVKTRLTPEWSDSHPTSETCPSSLLGGIDVSPQDFSDREE